MEEILENEEDLKKVFEKFGLYDGRMMSYSKSGYHFSHPFNIDIFNAVVVDREGEVLLSGCDLDLTLDSVKLLFAAELLQKDLYVSYESAYRDSKDTKDGYIDKPIQEDCIEIGESFSPKLYLIAGGFWRERYDFSTVYPGLKNEYKLEAADRNTDNKILRYGKYYDSNIESIFSFDYYHFLFWNKIYYKNMEAQDRLSNGPNFLYSLTEKIDGFCKRKKAKKNWS